MKLFPVSEDWARTINVLTAIFAAIAVVAGGFWTLYQYEVHKTEELHNQFIQSINPLLQKRMELYLEATTITATIATSQDAAQVAEAKGRFLILYHGPLGILPGRWRTGSLGSPAVTGELARIDECVESPKCHVTVQMSDRLANACKLDLVGQWLPAPPGKLSGVSN